MLLHRRSPPLKIAFNLALFAADTGLAIAVFRAVAVGSHTAGPLTWLAAYCRCHGR